jgi:hypothetical protein
MKMRDARSAHAAVGDAADRRLAPRQTGTDRIEAALNALIEDQKKSNPTTH